MKFIPAARSRRSWSLAASFLLGTLLTAGASGCWPAYGPKSSIWGRDGYVESKLDESTWQVTYHSTRDMETAERYLIFRCAEIAVENGFDYFITSNQRTSQNRESEAGKGVETSGRDYIASARIALVKGRKPESSPSMLDAHQVLENLGPTIRR